MFNKNIMKLTINLAQNTSNLEVPVASVVAIDNEIISFSDNRIERDKKEWYHAEFLAIEKALQKLGVKYLDKASIYVTLEPCILCSALLDKIRIKEIFFGAYNLQQASLTKCLNLFPYLVLNTTIIGGLYDKNCFKLIENCFRNLRK